MKCMFYWKYSTKLFMQYYLIWPVCKNAKNRIMKNTITCPISISLCPTRTAHFTLLHYCYRPALIHHTNVIVSLYRIDLSVRDHLRKLVSHQLAHHYCSSTHLLQLIILVPSIHHKNISIFNPLLFYSISMVGRNFACLLIIISLPRLISHFCYVIKCSGRLRTTYTDKFHKQWMLLKRAQYQIGFDIQTILLFGPVRFCYDGRVCYSRSL